MDTLSPSPGAAPAPVPSLNGHERTKAEKKRAALLSNPGKGYAPSMGAAWWGYTSHHLDGMPIFTFLDIPRMLRDYQITLGLQMLVAPFMKCEFETKANSHEVEEFVANTVKRFWRRVVPQLLYRYFAWGHSAAELEFSGGTRTIHFKRGKVIEPQDLEPFIWKAGRNKGQFAGFRIPAHRQGQVEVYQPHALWFAGLEQLGRLYDRPRLAGAFMPWLEKNGRNGALHSRRLGLRKCAFDGGVGYYPPGETNIGTDDAPDVRMNQDLMRQQMEYAENGSALLFPSTLEGDGSHRKWEYERPQSNKLDFSTILEYPERLDKDIMKGLGIPPEVVEASEVGSGWSGRMIPAEAYLGSADVVAGLLLTAFDECTLRRLVLQNFGPRAKYEVETKPLAETLLRKTGGAPGMPQPGAQTPPAMGEGGGGGGDDGDLANLFSGQPGGGGNYTVPFEGPRGGHWLKDLRTGKLRHRGANMAHGDPTGAEEVNDPPAGLDHEHAAALYYALLATAEHAQRTKAHPDMTRHALDALADLADNPEELGRLLQAGDLAHWVPFQTRRGTTGALNPENQRKLYGQRAIQALEGHAKRSAREASSSRARELLRRVYFGESQGPEHFAELADHLPSLNVEQLKAARMYLGQHFPDAKRRDELVSTLVRYAQNEASRRLTVGPEDYGLPPGEAGAAARQESEEAKRARRQAPKAPPIMPEVKPKEDRSPLYPDVPRMPGLTEADRAVETKAWEKVNTDYAGLRAEYLKRNATTGPDGSLKSVVVNTDDWRDLFDGYTGTNASAVHEPASTANKKLLGEMMQSQQGKGNKKFLILAGGGGSGKGTALGQYFDQREFPLVLDQVSDNLEKLEKTFDGAKGFEPTYTFVDRKPADAWDGVVGRALYLRSKGQPARTVPLQVALKSNLAARRTALEFLKKRPDIPATIIDNVGGEAGSRRLLTDRQEAIAHLERRLKEDEDEVAAGLHDRLHQSVLEKHRSGQIPRDIAAGFLGEDALNSTMNTEGTSDDSERVPEPATLPADHPEGAQPGAAAPDRLAQPRRVDEPDPARAASEPEPAEGDGRAEAEAGGGADRRGVDHYVQQAMSNLRKTSRTAGGVVDTSASKGKADKIVEGLTGEQAAKAANDNFEKAVHDVHGFATSRIPWLLANESAFGLQTETSALADKLNQSINKGITKEGVLLRTDNSTKFNYTDVRHLPLAQQQFAKEFARRLADPNADPVETAAWVEWRVNLTDHAYADGVGKTSKALAMIPLMKAGLPLPEYPDNKEFFKYGPTHRYNPNDGPNSYLDEGWEKFRDFYKGLVPGGDAKTDAEPIDPSKPFEVADVKETSGRRITPGGVSQREYEVTDRNGRTAKVFASNRDHAVQQLLKKRKGWVKSTESGKTPQEPAYNKVEGTSHDDSDPNRLESQGSAGGQGRLQPGAVAGRAEGASGRALPGADSRIERPGATGSVLPDERALGEGAVRGDGSQGDSSGVGAGDRQEGPASESGGTGAGSGRPADGAGSGGGRGDGGRSGAVAAEAVKAEEPTAENPTDAPSATDFKYDTRDFHLAGPKQKFRWNVDAIKTLRKIQAEGRETATPEEQAILAKFIGWGQFGQTAFNHNATKGDWKEEQDELRSLLGEEGYEAARKSTQNSHYTDPSVVDAHWKIAQKLGFKRGRYLETSAGVGYYLGMMPDAIRNKVHTTAVEKDPTPAGMLKLLYPNADVREGGIEDQKLSNDYYDLVASNVPFGDYGVYDPEHNHYKAKIHDYFFLKSAQKVRPGGIVQHITSLGTMDKQDPTIRKKLADTHDLVAAIRFPGEIHKGGAGTSVATDMVILRKRLPGEAPQADQSWTETTEIPDPMGGEPIRVNKYFVDHPEHVLGRIDRSGQMYRSDSKNVSRLPDYEWKLKAAIDSLPENITTPVKTPSDRLHPKHLPQPGQAKQGSFHIDKDGKVFVNTKDGLVEHTGHTPDQLARLKSHLGLRDAVRACLNKQREGSDASAARMSLNRVYDEFVKKHGYVHDKKNLAVFADDPDHDGLLALEVYDPATKKATKADIFHKDVVRSGAIVQKADNAKDALGVSLHETGGIDPERMAAITGIPQAKIEEEIHAAGLAYPEPSGGWKPRNEYLSGNVRSKLAEAQAAAKNDKRFQRNVDALLKVQPEDIPFLDITARMGVPWVPASDIADFAAHVMGPGAKPDHFQIQRDPLSGKWHVAYTSAGARLHRHSAQANQVLGTFKEEDRKNRGTKYQPDWRYEGDHGVGFMDVLRAALGPGIMKVTRKEKDDQGRERDVVDKEATDAANERVTSLKEKFNDWIWTDQERRERLHRAYNDQFNDTVPMDRKGSGAHQTFPGLNPNFKPHDHIPDFVWQVVTKGRGAAIHEVGMGKTAAMVMSAMELRRLGLARKPAIAALKSNIQTITDEARNLYPGARILSTAGMYDAKKRKAIMAKIATGDYDLVIMTHDHLDKMKMSKATQREFIRDELKELEETKLKAIEQSDDPDRDPNVKRLENAKEKLELKLKEALDDTKKDDALGFEESGIDHLFVDEAHYYKTLPNYSQMGQVKGIGQGRSDRATEMAMRTRWLLKQNRGRGVVFATGTPVTNTMGELFNIQRFIQPDLLKARGLEKFDDWARTFGDLQTKNEQTVTGERKPVTRFSKYVNIPELKQMILQDLDIQRVDDPGNENLLKTIKRPEKDERAGIAKPSKLLLSYIKDLQKRARAIAKREVTPDKDNMLTVSTDGKKASMDMRLVDENAPDDPGSKTNLMVNNVLAKHKERPDQVQLIFSDLGVHPVKNGFHLYKDIIDKLVRGGIPREKIANFATLEKDAKNEAMAKMRRGEIVVAIGGTKRLGTGVNIQDRVMGIHHLDVPDRPDMLEQRNGRGFRNGNLNAPNPETGYAGHLLGITNYVTERSLDQTFWNRVAYKAKFIKQALDRRDQTRVMDEIDTQEMSPELMIAASAGDDRLMQQFDLQKDIDTLTRSQKRHILEQASHEQSASRLQAEIAKHERMIERTTSMLGEAGALKDDFEEAAEEKKGGKSKFALTVGDVSYGPSDRKEADEALKAAMAKALERVRGRYDTDIDIGTFRGLQIKAESKWSSEDRGYRSMTYFEDSKGHQYPIYGGDLEGLNRAMRMLRSHKYEAEKELTKNKASHESVSKLVGQEFPKLAELNAKKAKLAALEEDLMKNKPKVAEDDDETEDREFERGDFIDDLDETPNEYDQPDAEEFDDGPEKKAKKPPKDDSE